MRTIYRREPGRCKLFYLERCLSDRGQIHGAPSCDKMAAGGLAAANVRARVVLESRSVDAKEITTDPRQIRSEVLIVDDDPPIRNLLRQIFKRMGVDSREARDGIEALSSVEQSLPRLMLLDLMMPRLNGWEVLQQLRERGLLDQIPVVVLTAVGTQRTEGLSEYGVKAVLGKPFEIQDLITTVKGILDQTDPAA